jgi:hypothetical protein
MIQSPFHIEQLQTVKGVHPALLLLFCERIVVYRDDTRKPATQFAQVVSLFVFKLLAAPLDTESSISSSGVFGTLCQHIER